jgi:hypothetical protein
LLVAVLAKGLLLFMLSHESAHAEHCNSDWRLISH